MGIVGFCVFLWLDNWVYFRFVQFCVKCNLLSCMDEGWWLEFLVVLSDSSGPYIVLSEC